MESPKDLQQQRQQQQQLEQQHHLQQQQQQQQHLPFLGGQQEMFRAGELFRRDSPFSPIRLRHQQSPAFSPPGFSHRKCSMELSSYLPHLLSDLKEQIPIRQQQLQQQDNFFGGNFGGGGDTFLQNNMMMRREEGPVGHFGHALQPLDLNQLQNIQQAWKSPIEKMPLNPNNSPMSVHQQQNYLQQQPHILPFGGLGSSSSGGQQSCSSSLSSSGGRMIRSFSSPNEGSSSMGSSERSIPEENIEETEKILQQISRKVSPYKIPGSRCIQRGRLTLKMEVSYTDHSHLIGCRGLTIRKVMRDSGCHIHFPDSNKGSKDFKSNQVTIAGNTLAEVERARARIRELSPLIFYFSFPSVDDVSSSNLDQYQFFIDQIQTTYRVQVTLQSPNKHHSTTSLIVKGCEIDAPVVIEAVTKIMDYFCTVTGAAKLDAIIVETTMDITQSQHHFVRGVNDANMKKIANNTGVQVIFPDLTEPHLPSLRKSRVLLRGEINCVYHARQQLIGSLPIKLAFEIPDDYVLTDEEVNKIHSDLSVTLKVCKNTNFKNMEASGMGSPVTLKGGDYWIPRHGQRNQMLQVSPSKRVYSCDTESTLGYLRAVQLLTSERNVANIYQAKRRVLGMCGKKEASVSAHIPQTYQVRPVSSVFSGRENFLSN